MCLLFILSIIVNSVKVIANVDVYVHHNMYICSYTNTHFVKFCIVVHMYLLVCDYVPTSRYCEHGMLS